MMLLCYAILVGLLLVYVLHRYSKLADKYSALADEVCECYAEIERIKTLNKLKVDCNGNPIIYSQLHMDHKWLYLDRPERWR